MYLHKILPGQSHNKFIKFSLENISGLNYVNWNSPVCLLSADTGDYLVPKQLCIPHFFLTVCCFNIKKVNKERREIKDTIPSEPGTQTIVFFLLCIDPMHLIWPPKGGRGCLMFPPCLESQDCHLIPLCYLLSCSSAKSCYPFCLIFFCLLAFFSKLFPENSSTFFV